MKPVSRRGSKEIQKRTVLWKPRKVGILRVKSEVKVSVAQLCLTLSNPMDSSPPGSSVHGILQARILEWVARPSSRGSTQPSHTFIFKYKLENIFQAKGKGF